MAILCEMCCFEGNDMFSVCDNCADCETYSAE